MDLPLRTANCGEIGTSHVGQTITVNGWAHKVRDLGGLIFIDVRDRSGIVQVVFPENSKVDVRPESCIAVTGQVRAREQANVNPKMATGAIEVAVTSHEVFNPAGILPFPVGDEDQMLKVNEELRVKYRYLDLRRPSMLKKLRLRAAAISKIRAFLDNEGFIEVETPIITKSTPEGARDYLVPYRLEPGSFYALPQSPQQYKQLLMAAGVERYYQIAKCFRDESQRADRQPEFTQLDLEMSFCTQEQVLSLMESLTLSVLNSLVTEFDLEKDPVEPFQRLTYDQSLLLYGNDKPDLRFGLPIFDAGPLVKDSAFGVFSGTLAAGNHVRGILYPGGGALSRKQVTELEDFCKESKAKGMASFAVDQPTSEAEGSRLTATGNRIRGGISKFLTDAEADSLIAAAGANPGDLLCFVADTWAVTCETLSRLRNHIGAAAGLKDPRKLAFAFVVDFPLVDWNEDEQRWDPTHHPFTAPKAADLEFLESDPGRVRADCYDVVCNGTEWASGSIRIHHPGLQARVFSLIGVDEPTQKERFGHMLDAFTLGCPPHGGIAPGIDRLVMFLADEDNIREVIAFPKMGNGYDPLMDAPSPVDEKQWAEMGLRLSEVPKNPVG